MPNGFVVTTAAFRQALEHLDAEGDIVRRSAALDPRTRRRSPRRRAEIRTLVESAPLPADVADAVTRAYAALCAESGEHDLPVAVRSSATSEDSADASFAGLQDTYLWVRGAAEVLEHVRRCWASLYASSR